MSRMGEKYGRCAHKPALANSAFVLEGEGHGEGFKQRFGSAMIESLKSACSSSQWRLFCPLKPGGGPGVRDHVNPRRQC
jgi:hypothetical protein